MVRLTLPVSTDCAVPYRQLVDSAHMQMSALKRLRDEIARRDPQPRRKRPRPPQSSDATPGSDADMESPWLSYDRLQAVNRERAFHPLAASTSARIEAAVAQEFGDAAIERVACVVTDAWVFRSEACRLTLDELPLTAMRKVLAPPEWATPAVQACYDCSAVDGRLAGMLLSPRGLEQTDNGVRAWVSLDALRSLQSTDARLVVCDAIDDSELRPPRFAIADCFVAGTFDEIDAATQIERQTVGLVQTRGLIKVVYGGAGSMLQSHLLSWDNRHATIASRVPCVPARESFHVVLAGPMTTQQELVLAKQHECNGGRVQRLQALLRRVNPLYDDVAADLDFCGVADPERVYCTRLDSADDVDGLVAHARARQASAAAPAAAGDAEDAAGHETTVVQTETALVETAVDAHEEAMVARAVDGLTRRPTFAARHSTSILQQSDAHYMERLFPHLLTFGVGGFSSKRCRRYGKREIVVHYLKLSTNRFAEDPLFKMKMFDFLSSERVKNGVFLRVRHDPGVAAAAMRLSAEDLREAADARARRRSAARAERPEPPSERGRGASSVLRSINASVAKMWGSNEEREAFRRKVQAMEIMYGQPSIFWTLTPNPDGSIAVAFWSGYDLPNGRPKDLAACTVVNMPCNAEMKRLVAQNAVVQALFYKVCCKILIDVMFGWDSAADRPKAEPGIFGFVEALFYAVEQQGRLRVHHHGVLWVAGLPRTKGDWDELLADAPMRARFEAYCASIFAEELPVFDSAESIDCALPGCGGELAPVPIHLKFKHLLKRGTPPPKVAVCGACATEFTDAEIVAAAVERKWGALGPGDQAVSTERAVCSLKMRFGGLSARKPVADVQFSRLLLKDQMHAFEHTHSCVKGTTGTKCRYKFPRPLTPATGLTERNEMAYRRRLGSQWLNGYVPLWRRLFHFNMDARMLWSGQSLQATRYAIQYASKRQSVLDNAAVVEMALRRRVQRESALAADKTESEKGVGRLLSLAFSSSGVMEIGGPLATTILLEGGAAKFSCKFERLVLSEGLHMLDGEDVEASVVSRGCALFAETSIQRYMGRPPCLEDCSWFDFCAWYKQCTSTASASASTCTVAGIDPVELAAHVRPHGLAKVQYPQVPEIIGPRMPDARLINDEEHADQCELYCRVALLLYCPFRRPTDFLDEGGSARRRFEHWDPSRCPKLQRSLDFHQQHYLSLDEASEFHAEQAANEDSNTCDDRDVQSRHSGGGHEDTERLDSLVAVSADAYAVLADAPEVTPDEATDLQSAVDGQAMRLLLTNNVVNAALPDDNTASVVAKQRPVSKAELDAFERQLETAQASTAAAEAGLAAETTEVTVELLNEAVANLQFDGRATSTAADSEVAPFASVQDVSRAFALNSEQHIAFVLVAVPLLYQIAGAPLPERSSLSSTPLIVTGPGGTGKTRIIDAVRALAKSWNRPRCVMATASTGIAASNVSGHTMHSSVGLGINQTHLPKRLEKPSEDMFARWDPVLCVVADELSMADIGFFGLWEEALRKVKGCPAPFGGLVTVLMLDICQLLTVRGSPVFKHADPKKPFSQIQARGSLMYQSIDKVVYLQQNMRFAQDPEWGQWLANARLGEWVPDMRAFLRQVPPPPAEDERGELVQVISTDNASRQQINNTAVRIACRALSDSRRVFAFPSRLPKSVTPADQSAMQRLADSQTGNIPVFQKVYIGMPVRVKSNLCIRKGVANGANGVVYHIDWRPTTSFTRKDDGVWLASAPPANVYVDIPSSSLPVQFPGLPAAWPASVMPIAQTKATFKFEKRTISINGFPIVPAFGTTVHGVQGDTRDQIVITDLRPPHFPRVDRHALYVALSRVRTRVGLYWLGRKLDDSDYDYFRPSQDVMNEDARLRALAADTCQRTDLQSM